MKLKLYSTAAALTALLLNTNCVNAQWTRNAATSQTYLTNTGDNVGIGTTTPAFKLDIQGTGVTTMSFKSTTNNASILLDRGTSSNTASLTYRTAGGNNWQTGCVSNNNYTIRNNSLGSVAMFFDYVTNYVGVGTTTPTERLQINGNVLASGNVNALAVNATGTMGIGTTSSLYKLNILGSTPTISIEESGASNANILFRRAGVNKWLLLENFGTPVDNIAFYDYTTGSKVLQINQGGNVGIGTSDPATRLDVAGPGNWDLSNTQGDFRIGNGAYNIRMGIALAGGGAGYSTISATTALQLGTGSTYPNLNTLNIVGGNVGVGTTAPLAKLDVAGTICVNDNNIYLRGTSNTDHFLGYDGTVNGPLLSGFDGGALGGTVPNATVLRWTWDGLDGKVGIGTNTPAYKLDVCGTIRAKEIRIETGWCDYVFANDYKLKSVDEVAAYINDHKHLPGIVPAAEVEKEGMKVGEMSKAMMEKIEELMLYVIDQNNQIKELKKQNQSQQEQIDNLKK